MNFLWYIIIGIVAGFLAGKIMHGGGFGLIVNLIVGRLDVRPFRHHYRRDYRESHYFGNRSRIAAMDRVMVL